jgi:peroxiredoxin
MDKLRVGDVLSPRSFTSITGDRVTVPGEQVVHLQFRRYAGCPVCNLHLHQVAQRIDDIKDAGIREVVFFHSEAEVMLPLQGQLPFETVADPGFEVYKEFGVGRITWRNAWRGLTWRSWRSAARGLRAAPSLRSALGDGETKLGLPAEFLIARDGRILALRYGKYVDDHWSVDELLEISRNVSRALRSP